MDRTAQSVWVATSTTIARFEVFSITTVTPVSTPGTEDEGVTTPDVAPGLEEIGLGVCEFFGCESAAAGLAIFGLLLMLLAGVAGFIVSGGLAKIRRRQPIGNLPPAMAFSFAGVMFFINGVAGIFNGLIIFGGIVVVGIVVYFFRRGG
jgi:hypothetical protein